MIIIAIMTPAIIMFLHMLNFGSLSLLTSMLATVIILSPMLLPSIGFYKKGLLLGSSHPSPTGAPSASVLGIILIDTKT